MALVKGTNSYSDVVAAEAYFSLRLDVAAWLEASEDQKAQALVTATMILESYNWTGIALSASQPLAFPRSGSYFDPRLGRLVTFTEALPDRLVQACHELAYHLLNNDGMLDDSGSVKDLQLGSISLRGIKAPSKMPDHVYAIVKPMLANAGAHAWWRAN